MTIAVGGVYAISGISGIRVLDIDPGLVLGLGFAVRRAAPPVDSAGATMRST